MLSILELPSLLPLLLSPLSFHGVACRCAARLAYTRVLPRFVSRRFLAQLHTVAAYYPERPSTEEVAAARGLFSSLLLLYPCTHCRAQLAVDMEKLPLEPALASRRELSLWVCQQHNFVNEALGASRGASNLKFSRSRSCSHRRRSHSLLPSVARLFCLLRAALLSHLARRLSILALPPRVLPHFAAIFVQAGLRSPASSTPSTNAGGAGGRNAGSRTSLRLPRSRSGARRRQRRGSIERFCALADSPLSRPLFRCHECLYSRAVD